MMHRADRFAQWLPALFDGVFDWDFLLPAFTGTKAEWERELWQWDYDSKD